MYRLDDVTFEELVLWEFQKVHFVEIVTANATTPFILLLDHYPGPCLDIYHLPIVNCIATKLR